MPTMLPLQHSFLDAYRLPARTFTPTEALPVELQPIWEALAAGQPRFAQRQARELLGTSQEAGLAAPLEYALAAAAQMGGHFRAAEQHARASLEAEPRQWAAHRILMEQMESRHENEGISLYLNDMTLPEAPLAWDDPLPERARYLAAAAWSWKLGDWDTVATYLLCAFPDGVGTMPKELQEDWFRLALYRVRPDDAADAAVELVTERSIESADALLQAIVQQGWTEQALPLYRSIYADAPQNELLRRRLIALCIREGVIDEARRLSSLGALKTTSH